MNYGAPAPPTPTDTTMKRSRFGRRGGLSRDAEQLVWLATGLAESGSRAEDRYWEIRLTELIDAVLAHDDEDTLNSALDHLYSAHPRAYDELADFTESRAEAGQRGAQDEDVLLIAAPVLAWSRYRIPATPVPPAVLANLRVHLQAHVLANGVKVSVADFLFSPDQLPQGYRRPPGSGSDGGHRRHARDRPVPVRHPLPPGGRGRAPRRTPVRLAGIGQGQP